MLTPTQTLPVNLAPATQAKLEEAANSAESPSFSHSLVRAVKGESEGKPSRKSVAASDKESEDDKESPANQPPLDVLQMANLLIPTLKIETANEGKKETQETAVADSKGDSAKAAGATRPLEPLNSPQTSATPSLPAFDALERHAAQTEPVANAGKGFALSNLFERATPNEQAAAAKPDVITLEAVPNSHPDAQPLPAFNADALDRLPFNLPAGRAALADSSSPKPDASVHIVESSAVSAPVSAKSHNAETASEERNDSQERDGKTAASAPPRSTEAPLNEKFALATNGSNATKETAETSSVSKLNVIERMQVIEQVSRKMEVMRLQNGAGEVNMHLRPEHLGEIQIRLASDSEGVSVRILAEHHAVREALEGAKEQLQRSLESRGVSLKGYEASLMQGAFSGGQSSPRHEYAPGRNRSQASRPASAFHIEGVERESRAEAVITARPPVRDPLAQIDYSA